MTTQQDPTSFNQAVGANVAALREAANKMSQVGLAHELELRGLHLQQQIVANIERGVRPLKFHEAVAIAEILGVPVTALYEARPENEEIAAAVAQLKKAAADRALKLRQVAELQEQIAADEQRIRKAMRRLEGADSIEAGQWHAWIEDQGTFALVPVDDDEVVSRG